MLYKYLTSEQGKGSPTCVLCDYMHVAVGIIFPLPGLSVILPDLSECCFNSSRLLFPGLYESKQETSLCITQHLGRSSPALKLTSHGEERTGRRGAPEPPSYSSVEIPYSSIKTLP